MRGSLCVDNNLAIVSPRIRALQDRLLDSLPVEGAWECLSPPQRDAIISIHRSRLTPEGYNRFPKDAKWKHKNYSEFGKYGRSRSFEDKLESETDDSGVRLASGTSTSNSLEDDSSDPGVKKPASKFKPSKIESPNIQNNFGRLNRYDNTRRPVTKPKSSKLTLDCRNLMDKNRVRVDNVFSHYNKNYDDKSNLVSRRNILEKHKSPVINYRKKNSVSSEDCDSGGPRSDFRHRDNEIKNSRPPDFRYPSTDREEKIEYDAWSKPRKDMYSPNLRQKNIMYSPMVHQKKNEMYSQSNQNKEMYSPNTLPNKDVYSPTTHQNKKDLRNKKDRISSDIRLNMFDYRNNINQDYSKYSSNWNNIILDNNLSIKPPTHIPSTLPPKSLVNPYNSHEVLDNTYPREEKSRKYVRSKSLDRKYLDDSSDDDDDFSNRRRLERMKRTAKNNAEWEDQLAHKGRYVKRQRSKSAWDLTDKDEFDDPKQNAPCSRRNILSKWKSEDIDLSPRPNEFSNLRRYYGEGRSLEDLDGARERYKEQDLSRQRWRRSHDFELDRDDSEFGAKQEEFPFQRNNIHRKRYVEKSQFYPATDHKIDPRLKSPIVGKQYPPYYNRVNVPPPNFMYQKPKSRGLFSGKLKIFKSILSF